MSHEAILLTLESRDVAGKAAKTLRREGFVPGVIYDHGTTSHIIVASVPIVKAFKTVGHSQPVELQIGAEKKLAMIRKIDVDPVKHLYRHVIFQAINRNEKVEAEVAIVIRGEGETPAERAGLIILSALEKAEIRALPKYLPEHLEIDGQKLVQAGDRVTLADVELPEGVEYADFELDLDLVVANVYEPSAIAAANDAAAGAAEDASAEQVTAENGEEIPKADVDQPENNKK